MDEQIPEVEMNREQAMMLMYAQGYSFADMVAPLVGFGLLDCQESHRKRPQGDAMICATCENTVLVSWRRHLKAIGATKLDIAEVKGAWFVDQEAVRRICLTRHVQDVLIETTRTELVDGVPVTTTTRRTETQIHVGLLRLLSEVRDKIARVQGLNVKAPASTRAFSRRLLNAREVAQDGADDRTN